MRKREILAVLGELLDHLQIAARLLVLLAVFFGGIWILEMAAERWPVPVVGIGLAVLLRICWSEWRSRR